MVNRLRMTAATGRPLPTAASFDPDPAWPDARPTRRRLNRRSLLAALASAAAVAAVLPASEFRGHALVLVTETATPAAALLVKTAADAALSKPVLSEAARSLIGTGYAAPSPDLFERLAVAIGIGGAQATSGETRLAENLASHATALPGTGSGTLDLSVGAADTDQSARLTTALAQAFVAESEAAGLQRRRQAEADAAERLGHLKAAAIAAHGRVVELGGTEADPADLRAAAVAQVAAARTRVDAFRAIIASGSPPMSDRRDVPPSIETLQGGYLDVSRQLAKALETLGDRHTTVIGLREEVRRASAALSAEWRRLARIADSELAAAQERERAATKAETANDGRRTAIAQARETAQLADARVDQAERAVRDIPDGASRIGLMAPASAPARMVGVGPLLRAALAALAGLLAFAIASLTPVARRRLQRHGEPTPAAVEPSVEALAVEAPAVADDGEPEDDVVAERVVPPPPRRAPARRAPAADPVGFDLGDCLDRLWALQPSSQSAPVVMVAAVEPGIETTPAALALGRAAASGRRRVLLVDAQSKGALLAAAADPEADPVVVDLYGQLRVALPSDGHGDDLYLAPGFSRGDRMASGLLSNGAHLIDDLGDAFDLVIVDVGLGGHETAGWDPTAVVGIGRDRSMFDTALLASRLDVAADAVVGMIFGRHFVGDAGERRRPRRPTLDTGAPRPVLRVVPGRTDAKTDRPASGTARRRIASR